jgi:hypothetical protein
VGRLKILYPRIPTVDAMRVKARQTLVLPGTNGAFVPSTPGTDGVKAILFTESQAAMDMLAPFIKGGQMVTLTSREARDGWKSREWNEENLSSSFYTTEMITMILPAQDGTSTGTSVGF